MVLIDRRRLHVACLLRSPVWGAPPPPPPPATARRSGGATRADATQRYTSAMRSTLRSRSALTTARADPGSVPGVVGWPAISLLKW